MKYKLVYAIALLSIIIAVACNKDKFVTKPTLTFKSINATRFIQGNEILMNVNVTDKEGDIQDTLFIYKLSRRCQRDTITFKIQMPTFPSNKNLEATIQANFTYNLLNARYPFLGRSSKCGVNENDSCTFKFILKDKAGNRSDSVVSPEIVLVR